MLLIEVRQADQFDFRYFGDGWQMAVVRHAPASDESYFHVHLSLFRLPTGCVPWVMIYSSAKDDQLSVLARILRNLT